MRNLLKKVLRILSTSAAIAVIVAIIAVIYTFFTAEYFTLQNIFNANFAVGGFIVTVGIVIFALPPFVRKSTLLADHSNYASVMMKLREEKRKQSYELLYTGMGVIVLAGLAELFVWLLT